MIEKKFPKIDKNTGKEDLNSFNTLGIQKCSFSERQKLKDFMFKIASSKNENEKVELKLMSDENFNKYVHDILFKKCLWNMKPITYPDTFESDEEAEINYMKIFMEAVQENLPLYFPKTIQLNTNS